MNPGQLIKPGDQAKQNPTTAGSAKPSEVAPSPTVTAKPNKSEKAELPEDSLLSWETSEYIEHDRNAMWYVAFVGITFLFAGASILLLHEWLGAVVLVLMAIAVLMFTRREPKTLQCSLQGNGINIGDRFYPYGSFRSFSLVSDGALQSLEFDPLKRFMPRLSVYIAPGAENKVLGVLASRLPQGDREQDAVDRLARKLKI
jgi:hypothetical protein